MATVDEYGQLLLSVSDRTPIQAWAILSAGRIDPDRIFPSEEHVRIRAAIELESPDDVVPVLVTGHHIERRQVRHANDPGAN